jgi:hypothetical protein
MPLACSGDVPLGCLWEAIYPLGMPGLAHLLAEIDQAVLDDVAHRTLLPLGFRPQPFDKVGPDRDRDPNPIFR